MALSHCGTDKGRGFHYTENSLQLPLSLQNFTENTSLTHVKYKQHALDTSLSQPHFDILSLVYKGMHPKRPFHSMSHQMAASTATPPHGKLCQSYHGKYTEIAMREGYVHPSGQSCMKRWNQTASCAESAARRLCYKGWQCSHVHVAKSSLPSPK